MGLRLKWCFQSDSTFLDEQSISLVDVVAVVKTVKTVSKSGTHSKVVQSRERQLQQ